MKPALGVLMLETRFPRPVGDIGNDATWSFPVRYRTVAGASPDRAVRRGAEGLLAPFIGAGRALAAEGAALISTSCGFLSLFQAEMSAALPVPVATSALLCVAEVEAALPARRRAGVLTISAESLTPAHLAAAGAPVDTPVAGVAPGCHLQSVLLSDGPRLDQRRAEAEMVAAARAFQAERPDLGAIVLECANMPPYSQAVAAATGLPVHSIVTLLNDRMREMA